MRLVFLFEKCKLKINPLPGILTFLKLRDFYLSLPFNKEFPDMNFDLSEDKNRKVLLAKALTLPQIIFIHHALLLYDVEVGS